MSANEPSLRELNMAKRRQRILHEARSLITAGGFDALNLRNLASCAEVTVPTLYNLIGNKESIVFALFSDAVSEIEQRIGNVQHESPLATVEAATIESTGLFAEDENYYRAAFVAVEYLDQLRDHHDAVSRIYRSGERIVANGLRACVDAGLLRGKIDPEVMSEQIIRAYRTSCRAWAFGQISIEAFRSAALVDLYINLAADAVETFQATVIKRIAALEGPAPHNSTKLASTERSNP